jgi:hypothetical protein
MILLAYLDANPTLDSRLVNGECRPWARACDQAE